MNKETYEALQVVVELAKEANPHEPPVEIKQVEAWIDEVAKEYDEDKKEGNQCRYCGENNNSADPDVLCSQCRGDFGHGFYSEL